MTEPKQLKPDFTHPFKWVQINRSDEVTGGETVFISSTCYDLADLRNELYTTIMNWGLRPILSDIGSSFFESYSIDSISSCLLNVDHSDVFILILSQRYSISLSDFSEEQNYGYLSATHTEICRALTIRQRQEKSKNDPSKKFKPLIIIVCIREELYKAYQDWKDVNIEELCEIVLENCCKLPCRLHCKFSAILFCCDLYLNSRKPINNRKDLQKWVEQLQKLKNTCLDDSNSSNYGKLINQSCERLINLKNSWINLFPDSESKSVISDKALNRYRLQALAQFFLLHILERWEKEANQEWQLFKTVRFNTVTDLKDKIYNVLQSNIQRARFQRALTKASIPFLDLEIPNVLAGTPVYLFLILKNVGELPVIWTQQIPSFEVYQISRHDYSTNRSIYMKEWRNIGQKVFPVANYFFESPSSTLLAGESTMIRIEWKDDLRNSDSLNYYFVQINYRTSNDLYISDIFQVRWIDAGTRPLIRFVKKIPYHSINTISVT